jgi:hypothetical protein
MMSKQPSQFIDELADLMNILAKAANQLKKYLTSLDPNNSNSYQGSKADIDKAIDALNKELIERTSMLLEVLRNSTKSDDLDFAIKKVECYLQETNSLEKSLDDLSNSDLQPHPSYQSGQNQLRTTFECSSEAQDLYKFVPCVRKLLEKTRAAILKKLNFIEITILLNDSQNIYCEFQQLNNPYSLGCDLKKVTEVVRKFIDPQLPNAVLPNAKNTFKKLREQNITLSNKDITDTQELVKSWTEITGILNEITQKVDLSNPKDSREAIACALDIDNLLDEIYSDIADIFRGQDLLTPAIL